MEAREAFLADVRYCLQ
jgi:hypothetical protein